MSTIKIISNGLNQKQEKKQKADSYRFSYLLQQMNLSMSHLTPRFFLSMKAKAVSEGLWEELFIALEQELDNKLFGYDLGSLIDLNQFGTFGKIILNSDSFESALNHIVKYVNMSNDVVMLKLISTDQGTVLSIEPNNFSRKNFPVSTKHFCLMLLGAIHGTYNLMVQRTLKPLQYEIPNYLQDSDGIDQIFENEIVYSDNKRFRLVLSKQSLRARSLRSNPVLLASLLHQITASRKFINSKWSHKVEQMLHHRHAIANVGLYAIATELDLSERTLQRYLNEEQTTFKAIKEKVRLKQAKFTLVKTQDVEEAAQNLGFPNSSSFNKSFRKWSGQSVWSFLECA